MENYLIDSRKFTKLKSVYAMAIRANIDDKFRKGNLIELPSQGDVVITGDLHGNINNFNKIISAIDLKTHPYRHLIVQEPTHTYEATEDLSYLLIEKIVELKSKFPNQIHTIVGNHELSEVTGKEIIKGGICYNILFREGMKKRYHKYYSVIRELMHDFMKTMPLACKAPNKIFICHSTPPLKYIPFYTLNYFRKGKKKKKKDTVLQEKLVWGRDLTPEAADAFAKKVDSEIIIVGHTACKRGYKVPNHRHIVLDSKGIYATILHFRLNQLYTQSYLVKKAIQYINLKEVKSKLKKYMDKKKENRENYAR